METAPKRPQKKKAKRFSGYESKLVANRTTREIKVADQALFKVDKSPDQIVLSSKKASTFFFGEGFKKARLVVSVLSSSTFLKFTDKQVIFDEDRRYCDAVSVCLRIKKAIKELRRDKETDISDADIQDNCTLSLSVAQQLHTLVMTHKVPICACKRCYRGHIYVRRTYSGQRGTCVLACDACVKEQRDAPVNRDWLAKTLSKMLVNLATDNVIYACYAKKQSAHPTVVWDAIQFKDGHTKMKDDHLTCTVFIKKALVDKLGLLY